MTWLAQDDTERWHNPRKTQLPLYTLKETTMSDASVHDDTYQLLGGFSSDALLPQMPEKKFAVALLISAALKTPNVIATPALTTQLFALQSYMCSVSYIVFQLIH